MEPTKTQKFLQAKELEDFKTHTYSLSLSELIELEDYITTCITWYETSHHLWVKAGNQERVDSSFRMLNMLANKRRHVSEFIAECQDEAQAGV